MYRRMGNWIFWVLVLSVVSNAWGQSGTGLRAEYFYWTGASPPTRENAFRDLIVTRTEPQIYHYWNPGFVANHPDGFTPAFEIHPPPGIRNDNFAVRWEGYIEAMYSEPYTFRTGSDDGIRVYLDGQLIIDAWADQDRTEAASDPIQLAAGQKYPILVEGYENGGEAEWQFYWESPSTPQEVVPQRVLYPLVKPKDYLASEPAPEDDAIHSQTWVSLEWAPGISAVSHDMYFGESFDDVNEATPESDVFQGNQTNEFLIVGIQEYAYPDGLVPGTTYYWRIDEVNEADPNSPWKGTVWSFLVPPKTAYNVAPADGSFFVDPNIVLTWNTGYGARLHHLYFGDNYADVEAGTTDTDKGLMAATQYTPGTLELEKTYYWRVDEFESPEKIHTGDVLSFTVTSGGGGIRGDYYRGASFNNLVLTRIDPDIDFDWGENEPNSLVGDDNFSIRWTGEIGAQLSETYTFYTNTDDGVRLWVDNQRIINDWTIHGETENSGTIDLVGGRVYGIVMEYYDNSGAALAELSWESPSTPKQIIPTYVLSPPVKASSPSPPNTGVDTKQTLILKWGAGDHAVLHHVYFGTDPDAVANATTSSPEYKGSRDLGAERYDPGQLEWNTTYYWRIDEINDLNPESPWTGSLWSFTTANFFIVDNFEDYNDFAPDRIFDAWIDGYGTATNGSTVGYENPDFTQGEHFVETVNIHSGAQAMPYFYDNTSAGNSEATLNLIHPTDWTEKDVNTLTIWFKGNPSGLVEEPAGTYTVVASGADIWDMADEFRYVFRQLSGDGEIIAKVESIENTDGWAKAGVMIRDTLEPSSRHAFCCISASNGTSFQNRPLTGQISYNSNTSGFQAPYWVRLVRQGNTFTAYHSADGANWETQASSDETDNPAGITMSTNVYIGLAVTSHNVNETCTAVFSNVQTIGSVTPATWTHQAIGADMPSNNAEPMYVVLDSSAVVYHDNPDAALITEWTEWNIDLQEFADQGINLTNVTSIGLGFGDRSNPQLGGSGVMYFDDIRLRPPPEPEQEPEPVQ
ncbi:MAG: PA14 domain-containing protein [Phycisphaerales bacterium]